MALIAVCSFSSFVLLQPLTTFLREDVPLKQTVLASLSRPSLSAGVGLVYRLDPVRVELNFGVPLASSRSDGGRRGFQVGMGLEFL
jgi:outer membrane protein insertion porin family